MNPLSQAQAAAKRNFDPRIAFSSLIGVAMLGGVAFLMHRSNVKVLKKIADVATAKKK